MNPRYNIYQCNRCIEMEFSYFDDCVSRWCKAYDEPLQFLDIEDLKKKKAHCPKYNHKKGSKKKAKYLDKAKYLMRHPE